MHPSRWSMCVSLQGQGHRSLRISSRFDIPACLCETSHCCPSSAPLDLTRAEVAELADAHGSGPCTRKGVGVRVPSSAPIDQFAAILIIPRQSGVLRVTQRMPACKETPSNRLVAHATDQRTRPLSPDQKIGRPPFEERPFIHQACYQRKTVKLCTKAVIDPLPLLYPSSWKFTSRRPLGQPSLSAENAFAL